MPKKEKKKADTAYGDRLGQLFLTFLKIGAFTFGGGYAMLPLIEEEVVRHGWMSVEELVNFVAVSESTPGPFAINISTYVGAQTAGFAGALCATLGVSLPSIIVILIVARVYDRFRRSRIVEGCLDGVRPAAIGLIGAASISVGAAVFFPSGITVQGLHRARLLRFARRIRTRALSYLPPHPSHNADTDIRRRRHRRGLPARPAAAIKAPAAAMDCSLHRRTLSMVCRQNKRDFERKVSSVDCLKFQFRQHPMFVQ